MFAYLFVYYNPKLSSIKSLCNWSTCPSLSAMKLIGLTALLVKKFWKVRSIKTIIELQKSHQIIPMLLLKFCFRKLTINFRSNGSAWDAWQTRPVNPSSWLPVSRKFYLISSQEVVLRKHLSIKTKISRSSI